MTIVDPIAESIKFIQDCLALNQKLINTINRRGSSILLPRPVPRHRLYAFYNALIDSFNTTCNFVIQVTNCENITNKESLFSNIRTLLEMYSRALYLLHGDEMERLKRVLGDTIWVFRDDLTQRRILETDRQLGLANNIPFPDISNIDANGRSRNDFMNNFTFEKIQFRQVIEDHHDETAMPFMPKSGLIKLYKDYCNYVHGNVYFNLSGGIVNPIYQFIASMSFMEIHFLRTMLALLGEDGSELEDLVSRTKASGLFEALIKIWAIERAGQ